MFGIEGVLGTGTRISWPVTILRTIPGRAGDDVLAGEGGSDELYGDEGNDYITAAMYTLHRRWRGHGYPVRRPGRDVYAVDLGSVDTIRDFGVSRYRRKRPDAAVNDQVEVSLSDTDLSSPFGSVLARSDFLCP